MQARLALCEATRTTLRNALSMLKIAAAGDDVRGLFAARRRLFHRERNGHHHETAVEAAAGCGRKRETGIC